MFFQDAVLTFESYTDYIDITFRIFIMLSWFLNCTAKSDKYCWPVWRVWGTVI